MITVKNIALMSFASLLLVACADNNRRMESDSGYSTTNTSSQNYDRSEPMVRQSQSK
jgi:hypothetical protein